MKLTGIFQDLEHLYDFQTISYGSQDCAQAGCYSHKHFINLVKISLQMKEILSLCKNVTNGRTDERHFIIS